MGLAADGEGEEEEEEQEEEEEGFGVKERRNGGKGSGREQVKNTGTLQLAELCSSKRPPSWTQERGENDRTKLGMGSARGNEGERWKSDEEVEVDVSGKMKRKRSEG